MTDAELRALAEFVIERSVKHLRMEADDAEPLARGALALLTRCEKAEAGFEPERINRAAHRRGDDCAYMYGRECDCQEPDRLRAALARLEPTDERDIEAKRIENFLNGAAEGINQETGFPVFEHRVKVEWEDD
jgi:hypothetical protein